jgi:hypothetical protein
MYHAVAVQSDGAHDITPSRGSSSLDGGERHSFMRVGSGLVPETPLGRAFRDQAGVVNQRLAVIAHTVLFMVAGLATPLKALP